MGKEGGGSPRPGGETATPSPRSPGSHGCPRTGCTWSSVFVLVGTPGKTSSQKDWGGHCGRTPRLICLTDRRLSEGPASPHPVVCACDLAPPPTPVGRSGLSATLADLLCPLVARDAGSLSRTNLTPCISSGKVLSECMCCPFSAGGCLVQLRASFPCSAHGLQNALRVHSFPLSPLVFFRNQEIFKFEDV